MKRIVLAGCLFLTVAAQAVTLKEVFFRMPADLLPTLNVSSRRDLVDFYENRQPASVPSLFDNTATLSQLTDDCLMLKTSSVSSLQVKLLPVSDSVVVALINTVTGPLPDSRVRFFTKNWKPVKDVVFPALLPRCFLDTTQLNAEQIERFDRICQRLFVRLDADPSSSTIHARASIREDVSHDLLAPYERFLKDTLTLTWNGKGFDF